MAKRNTRKNSKRIFSNSPSRYIDELFPEEPNASDIDYCELMAQVAGISVEEYARNADSIDDNGDDFGDCTYSFGYDY